MLDVKFICFTGLSSTYMAERLNHIGDSNIKFSAIPFNQINNVKDSTDLFVLGSMYTNNILDRVKKQVGEQKVICLKKSDYSSNTINEIYSQVKEAL